MRALLTVLLLAAAALAGCADGPGPGDDAPDDAPACPGHWHAAFAVFVDGQRLSFNPDPGTGGHARFGDFRSEPGAGAHMHADDGILHLHPVGGARCIPLGPVLAKLAVHVAPGSMEVEGHHGEAAGRYTDNGTHAVRLFHEPWRGSWAEVEDAEAFLAGQVGNGDRFLVTYIAVEDEAGLQRQLDSVPELPSFYQPP